MRVSIFEPLLARLLAGPRPYVGTLVGFVDCDVAHVLGCLLDHVEGGTPGVGSELLSALPGGLEPLGVAGDSDKQLEEVGLLSAIVHLLPESVQQAVVVSVGSEGETDPKVFLYTDGQLSGLETYDTFSEAQLKQRTVMLRLEGALPLSCRPATDEIASAFDELQKLLDSPAACFVHSGEHSLLLRARGDSETSGTCSMLAPKKTSEASEAVFRLMLQRSGTSGTGTVPVIHYSRSPQTLSQLRLPLQCLAVVAASAPLTEAAAALRQTALRQLSQLRSAVADVYGEKRNIVPAAALHFRPEQLGHFLSLVYSDASPDEELESFRRDVHAALLLPADRPLFRRANSISFSDTSPYLTNVHVGLRPPKTASAPGAQTAVVSGRYVYHHYMQDRMDDSGWGCAYRSLQTLGSWFKLQGYVDRDPPSHREIQQCLVDIGDKEAKFVGSRQWIGSTEVNYVLSQLYGVESKILHVSSGEDLVSKGRALLQHFNSEGTPVMIGGGVLAHTLLGVCFDEESGDTEFLVLDPHYTGGEKLETVQGKGWCGWKDGAFWDATAYYNMCMPTRPRCV